MKYNVIMDLDTGIDDAVALVIGANIKKIDLKLITTTFGNVELKKVIQNTLVILDDINRGDVKVVAGEEKPLVETDFNISAHGKNGLGNYTHKTKLKVCRQNYINAMAKEIENNDMTYIICCGPLTNLAKFISVHPELNSKVCLIIVTGLLDIDHKNPYLNFNIQKDQLAFEQVLTVYENIVIVPSDLGHQSYIASQDFHKTAKCGRVGKILAEMYPYHLDRTVKDGAAMHDLCGVLWLAYPKLFETIDCYTKICKTKKGSYLSFDTNSKKPNTKLAISINVKKAHKIYYKTLKSIK